MQQILTSWFIHTLGLLLFMTITSAVILRCHRFFFGRQADGDAEEALPFYVVTTVLMAAVSIFLLSHWIPSGDLED